MAQLIREVMTSSPCVLDAGATVHEAARQMAERDIGDVIVCEGEKVCGIVTDRDITVRAVAQGKDASSTRLGDICSKDLITVAPDDAVDDAIRLMRDKAVRRLPVVEGGRPIGVLSIGDLAMERDQQSALADISAARPNN